MLPPGAADDMLRAWREGHLLLQRLKHLWLRCRAGHRPRDRRRQAAIGGVTGADHLFDPQALYHQWEESQ